jgi:hypothetical protein
MTVIKVNPHSLMVAREELMWRNFRGESSGAYTQTVQFQAFAKVLWNRLSAKYNLVVGIQKSF